MSWPKYTYLQKYSGKSTCNSCKQKFSRDTKLRLQTNGFNTVVNNPSTPEQSSSRMSIDHIGLVFSDSTETSSCHRHSSHPFSCSNSWWNVNAQHVYVIHFCQLFTENTEKTLEIIGHFRVHMLKLYASQLPVYKIYSVVNSEVSIVFITDCIIFALFCPRWIIFFLSEQIVWGFTD